MKNKPIIPLTLILTVLSIVLLVKPSSEHTNDIRSIIIEESAKYKINPRLVWSLIQAESDGRAHIEGPRIRIKLKGKYVYTRAVGLCQIIPEIWYVNKDKNDLFDPRINIKKGIEILNYYIKLEKENLIDALKSYNSGQNSKFYNYKYISKILNININKNNLHYWRKVYGATGRR